MNISVCISGVRWDETISNSNNGALVSKYYGLYIPKNNCNFVQYYFGGRNRGEVNECM
jgi:hypothetical protein